MRRRVLAVGLGVLAAGAAGFVWLALRVLGDDPIDAEAWERGPDPLPGRHRRGR